MTREEIAKQARIHSEYTRKKYHAEILNCQINTQTVSDNSEFLEDNDNEMEEVETYKNYRHVVNKIRVIDMDTVGAIMMVANKEKPKNPYESKNEETENNCEETIKSCKKPVKNWQETIKNCGVTGKGCRVGVLNFASYLYPGGGFMNGMTTQEEALCHESILYEVLEACKDYYRWNRSHRNNFLYENRALYTPDVVFERDGSICKVDVISCAAPNKNMAILNAHVSDIENSNVLKKRYKFILDIAEAREIDVLILGAWGCGVFGQDAKEVADDFLELLGNYQFKEIVFAVPAKLNGKADGNYKIFADRVKEYYKKVGGADATTG